MSLKFTVVPLVDMGVMATCTCCGSFPVVMPTVAPVIDWYMDTGIVTIPVQKNKKLQFYEKGILTIGQ